MGFYEIETSTRIPSGPYKQNAAGACWQYKYCYSLHVSNRKHFEFPELSDHINSDSCSDVSPLIGKHSVQLNTSIATQVQVFNLLFGAQLDFVHIRPISDTYKYD